MQFQLGGMQLQNLESGQATKVNYSTFSESIMGFF